MPTAAQKNAYYAGLLGWTPSLFGGSACDDDLVERVRQFQAEHPPLDPDGVCGPATYSAMLAGFCEEEAAAKQTGDELLARAGRLAVLHAKRLWLEDIVDPKHPTGDDASRARIDQFIRDEMGLHWSWEQPYREDGDFEWCGAFCSYVWGLSGLAEEWRRNYYASTYRLDRYGSYRAIGGHANPPQAGAPRRYLKLDEGSSPIAAEFPGDPNDPTRDPRPGDILLVGPCDKDYGAHVTLVERYDPATGMFDTLEGNGTGMSPRGVRQHGVVRAQRPVGVRHGMTEHSYHARRLIRPSPDDLS